MSKTASAGVVKLPETAVKSCELEKKEVCKLSENFLTSPNRVLFPDVVDGNVSTKQFLDAYYYFISIYGELNDKHFIRQ